MFNANQSSNPYLARVYANLLEGIMYSATKSGAMSHKRFPPNQSLSRKITDFPLKKKRAQFGIFTNQVEGSIWDPNSICTMAVFWICTTFLSRQPVIGPCLLGHQLCGSIHGLSKVALFQYRLILAEKKGICLDDRLAFRAPFVSGDHFLTKFFKCQPVHIAR